MFSFLLMPLFVLVQASPLRVAGPDPATVALGESSILRVQIQGAKTGTIPAPPKVSGLKIEVSGPSVEQRFQSYNGRTIANETISTWTLSLKPKRVGRFEIPSFVVKVGDQEYNVPARSLRCVENKAARTNTYLEMEGPGRPVYKGEIFEVRLRFGVRQSFFRKLSNPYEGNGIDLPIKIELGWEDLLPLESGGSRQSRQGEHSFVLGDGKQLRGVVARRVEVPPGLDPDFFVFEYTSRWVAKRTGKLLLDGPTMELQWVKGYTRDFPFQRPVLGKIERVGDPLSLEVRELPSAGRPSSFLNAVGNFRIKAQLSKTHFALGAPIVLRLRVEGEGNLPFLDLPPLNKLAGFNRFSMKVDRTSRSVIGRYELAAIDSGIKAFPPIEFSYFDPGDGRYKTLRTDPIPVEISGKRGKGLTLLKGAKPSLPEVDEDIRDFMELGDDGAAGPSPWLVWTLVGGPVAAFLLALALRSGKEREARDPGRRRAREAKKRFEKNLGAEGPLRAFSLYLADHFGWDEGAALDPKLEERLLREGVPENLRVETLALMKDLQASRYGGGGSEEERAARARALVTSFENQKMPRARGAQT